MKFGIKTIDDFLLKGKTVLCRVDINEPINKETDELKDITRIAACVPTVKELSEKGAKVVLLAHQGSDIEYKNYYYTKPHAKELSKLLGFQVKWIDDVCGPAARKEIKALNDGEVLLLDNVRFVAEEQTLFEMKLKLDHEAQGKTQIVTKLAPLADLYVCDAFAAAHRDQPSLCGFEQVLPSCMGRLFEREYEVVSKLMSAPQRPCVFVLGGAKISDAFLMMEKVLSAGIADEILCGGLVGNIMLAGIDEEIGSGSMDFIMKSNYGEYIEKAKQIYAKYKEKILIPMDLGYTENRKRKECDIGDVPKCISAVDIGTKTAERYKNEILNSATVFVNGPMGVFEDSLTELGTKAVWEGLSDTDAFTVVGGGDSITATKKFNANKKISYICTGGGALIQFLSGKELPVVRALRHGATL